MYIITNYYELNDKAYNSEPMPKDKAEAEFEIIHFQFRLGLRALEPELVEVSI